MCIYVPLQVKKWVGWSGAGTHKWGGVCKGVGFVRVELSA